MTAFIETDRLALRALEPEDATPAYLGWLNDPEVLRFRGPKAFPTSMDQLKRYIASAPDRGDLVLAVCERESGAHVGNIALNSILWAHGCAELSILIGEKRVWGKGYAKEAIAAVTRHGFEVMGLSRVWAESPNPSFNGAVAALGWVKEGVKRAHLRVDGNLVDLECWSILASDPTAAKAMGK